MRSRINDSVLVDPILDRPRRRVFQAGSATLGILPNHGVILLVATGAPTIRMAAPVAGGDVVLIKTVTATAALVITGTATSILMNRAGNTNITFDAQSDTVWQMGVSTTQWENLINSNAAFS